jgi:hypothetical protein
VLLVWRRNRGAILPAFAANELRHDFTNWQLPPPLSDMIFQIIHAAPGGLRLFVRLPRSDEPLSCSCYLEFNSRYFVRSGGALASFWKWLTDSIVGESSILASAAGLIQRAIEEDVFKGMLVCWDIVNGHIVGRDLYLTTASEARAYTMPLVRQVAPPDYTALLDAFFNLSVFSSSPKRILLFTKFSSTGAVSCHVKGLDWEVITRIEQRLDTTAFTPWLRQRYVQAPAIFSLSALPSGQKYCTAYIQYYNQQPWG